MTQPVLPTASSQPPPPPICLRRLPAPVPLAATTPAAEPTHSTARVPLAARADRPTIPTVAALCVLAFVAGYTTSLTLHGDRVQAEAERRSSLFLTQAIRAGIIQVDQDRLAELEQQVAAGHAPDADDDEAGATVAGP